MQKVRFPDGLKVIYQQKKWKAVIVEVMVNVGSNNETSSERGLSHFLEHMLFEGTEKRPTNHALTNEIEKIGGDFNAYTTNERTCLYVKVLKKHYPKAVEILADILHSPLFKEEDIAKEKNIVLREIDLVNDEPSYYQWILLQKNLFQKHPCRYPIYGDKKVIKELNRNKLMDYFKHNYVAKNMVVSIVGDIPNWKPILAKKFVFDSKEPQKLKKQVEPKQTINVVKKEKRKIANTYMVLGFKTVPRKNPDTYVLDIINAILGRGQSGTVFTELRSKRGLAYDVGTQNVSEPTFGYFAVYTSIKKKNVKLVKELILKELKKLQSISQKDLQEAKDYIEGNYLLEMEEGQKLADQLLVWELVDDARMIQDYIKKIKRVTISDIKKVAQEYFKKYTLVILEGK